MTAASAPQPFSRMDRSFLGSWWWTVDHTMLIAVFIIALFGVALVSSASPPVAQLLELDDYHFIKRHIYTLIPALIIMVGISMLAPRYIWRLCTVILLISVLGVVAVIFIGSEAKGARRWMSFAGISIQPSEFIKPAFAVVTAWLLMLQQKAGQNSIENSEGKSWLLLFKPRDVFPGFHLAAAVYFFILFCLLLQPDLGMSIVLTSVFVSQVFLAGMPFRYIVMLFLAGPFALAGAYIMFPHVKSRMDRFFFPDSGDNYQVEKSLDAFRHGGLWGTGPGQGTEKMNLPDAHADFIFSVAGEEFGLLFVLALMGLFLFILLRGYKRLMENGDIFSILAVGGLLTMFGLQALIHMGSSVNILPAKGMTMPFISYGGSSVISMGISMGIMLALTRRKARSAIARSGMRTRTKKQILQPPGQGNNT